MLIISGQQIVELNFLSFLSRLASKIAEVFRETVLRGQLKCMEIAKETGFAKPLLTETLKGKVQSAYIVFPNREAPEVNWEMKKIRAAWTSKKNAQEDDLMSSPVDYVESEDGKMYPMLHQPSAPKSKKGYRMICAFP